MGAIGFPMEERAAFIEAIALRLEQGEPLLQICRDEGMPGARTVYDWIEESKEFAARIARARSLGFDAIAEQCLEIADDQSNDSIKTEHGEIPNKEWIMRSKLRVETRLKLLAKWDPKRFGDAAATSTVNVAVGLNVITEEKRAEFIAQKRRVNELLKAQQAQLESR